MERGLMAYVTDPEMVRAAIARGVEQKRRLDEMFIRPCVDAAFVEEDLCSKKGPMLSPVMYREMCLPAFKQRIAQIRSHGDFDIVFHSCGNTRALLDQFIEAGVQVYQSIQTIPEMEIGALKRDFGDRLILWGGVPVEELVGGTPESVRAAVRDSMEKAAPGGGFILGPSHSIAFGTKYENFMAMLDEYDRLADRF
jgi:uroporphyrinogen-III decarboxylase